MGKDVWVLCACVCVQGKDYKSTVLILDKYVTDILIQNNLKPECILYTMA